MGLPRGQRVAIFFYAEVLYDGEETNYAQVKPEWGIDERTVTVHDMMMIPVGGDGEPLNPATPRFRSSG